MRIQVKADGKIISIPIPTGMIFNRAAIWTGLKIAKILCKSKHDHIPGHVKAQLDAFFASASEESVYILCDEIMRIKRQYGSWTFLEAEKAEGEQVKIML